VSLRIYNSYGGIKEPFKPLHEGEARIYVCGVTVYDLCHMGHARALVNFDVIVRYLRFAGYRVTFVRNYTDVDDKIIQRAAERGISCRELAEENIQAFQEDMQALDVRPADVEPRATEHIKEMIALVEALVERGHAYESGGDVMFSVRSFPGYCKLSGRNLDDMEAGARVEVDGKKRDPLDFVLWKRSKPGEPSWESPWGEGRPGWHIECSVMSVKYLDQPFDIHGGGKDLIFPHHENEIAQSEAGCGKPFVRYWMHNGHITVNRDKMAKSLKNFVTIREALQQHDAQAIRYFLLTTHYRAPLDYSEDGLREAGKRVEVVYETLARVDEVLGRAKAVDDKAELVRPEVTATIEEKFCEAMDDDFNTAAAIGHLSEPLRLANEIAEKPKAFGKPSAFKTLKTIRESLVRVGEALGLFGEDPAAYLAGLRDHRAAAQGIDPAVVEARIAERAAARQNKDWDRADAIRDELAAMGAEIMDGPRGTTWKVPL